MRIIKLSAIDSTNSYLLKLIKEVEVEDSTIVVTDQQTEGRGQMGTHWVSSPQKSLTFSIFKRFDDLSIQQQIYLSFAVSIGVKNTLEFYKIPEISIKWPNDIMSHSKKLAGILIENQTKHSKITSSVIGIGMNVNDENLDHLPNATSLLMDKGVSFSQNELMMKMIRFVLIELDRIDKKDFKGLHLEYEQLLFLKDKISAFKKSDGFPFNGIIKGVNEQGELKIENEDGIKSYRLKEITYLFQ